MKLPDLVPGHLYLIRFEEDGPVEFLGIFLRREVGESFPLVFDPVASDNLIHEDFCSRFSEKILGDDPEIASISEVKPDEVLLYLHLRNKTDLFRKVIRKITKRGFDG